MDKNFAIHNVTVVMSDATSTVQPQFTRSREGLLLAAYQGDYRGKSPGNDTQLQVRIAYQTVNGLQLPKKLNIMGSVGGSPFNTENTFSNCRATKR